MRLVLVVLAMVPWLAAAPWQDAQITIPPEWTTPTRPFHIIDNVHYVGTVDLASYLITTPVGHILIDSGMAQNAGAILDSIRALNFEPSAIRLLLTTQAHFDHVGAHARIKQLSGAKVLVSSEDQPILEGGGKGDYHFGPRYYFPRVDVDRAVHDGEVVSLGNTSLTARLTPGHTKGTTTWTMLARDRNGRLRHVMFMGSTAVNEGVRLVNNREYPQIASDFSRSFRVLSSLPCEVFLAAHSSAFDGARKAELARGHQGEKAFVDPQGCREAVERSERAFAAELERQRRGAVGR